MVTYDSSKDCMEVVFHIKGFPYVFTKNYKRAQWKYMYGCHMAPVCLWPNGQVKTVNWKAYFTYAEINGKGIDISIPGMVQEIQYNGFKLIRTESFPAYLKLSTGEVTGYLPIQTKSFGKPQSGAIANVFVDMGHSTTYLALTKRVRSDSNEVNDERILFSAPNSLKVIGAEKDSSAHYFVPATVRADLTNLFIKNVLHNFMKRTNFVADHKKMRPMGEGQILFGNDYDFWGKDYPDVEFLYFEYNNMIQVEREKVHIMAEELLLYAAYEAIKNDCTSIKVHFLHDYEKNDERFGEIYGLWENALNWVKSWTGMSKAIGHTVEGMQKYKALSWNVLRHIHEQKICNLPEGDIYVGVDIGWKGTVLTALKAGEHQNDIIVNYADIKYAGLDISTMRDNELSRECVLKQYPQILSVLLNGTLDIERSGHIRVLLEKFREAYVNGGAKSREYYQGLFDVIAMKIDEEAYVVPPDVYNNTEQFRQFLKMLTYNLILLFVEIGCLLGRIEGKKEKLYIYLCGNGSKFLRWISNMKHFTEITESNSHTLWIVKMKNSILDYVKKGMQVTGEETYKEIRIIMEKQAKQQMLEGYLYGECSTMLREREQKIEFNIIRDNLKENQSKKLGDLLSDVYADIFEDDIVGRNEGSKKSTNISEEREVLASDIDVISDERRRVCKNIIDKINNM